MIPIQSKTGKMFRKVVVTPKGYRLYHEGHRPPKILVVRIDL